MLKLSVRLLFLSLITLLLFSCDRKEKYPYTITDFKKEYRPLLTTVTSKLVFSGNPSSWYIAKVFSDKELMNLSLCEIPSLRALALEELVNRPSADQYSVIKNHLDDTAVVAKDMGEFGINFITVTDNMIQETKFRDSAEEYKIRELVISDHTYLSSAYSILYDLPHNEKNYQIVLRMAKQNRSYREISDALYALAGYKKKSDIPFIRDMLAQDRRLLNDAYYVMINFPDSAYIPLLVKNCKRLYSIIYPQPYRDIMTNQDIAIGLINALAVYKTKQTALILENILHGSTTLNLRDSMTYRKRIMDIVLENKCPEYAPMIHEMSGYIEEKRKDSLKWKEVVLDSLYLEPDTSHEKPVFWWPRNRWVFPE